MTVLTFKSRQAAGQPPPLKPARARLELEHLPASPTTNFYLEDAVRGWFIIGKHTNEALDGNQLGLAA